MDSLETRHIRSALVSIAGAIVLLFMIGIFRNMTLNRVIPLNSEDVFLIGVGAVIGIILIVRGIRGGN
jgi:hypothetical protein